MSDLHELLARHVFGVVKSVTIRVMFGCPIFFKLSM